MPFVAARCPQCGGNLQIDNEIETGFCLHCGSKIVVQDAIRNVRIDNSHMVESWMKIGDLAYESKNFSEAYAYYTKIIETTPNNCWAVFKKGKAGGWQSTKGNSRFSEAIVFFTHAIDLAPEAEKEKIMSDVIHEIKLIGLATISLQCDPFITYPSQEEANGLMREIQTINDKVVQFSQKYSVDFGDFLELVADKINSGVVSAWVDKIAPEYHGIKPGKNDLFKFLERIDFCILIIRKAIEISGNYGEKNIPRYVNVIRLENEALVSCSWGYKELGLGWDWLKNQQLRTNNIARYNEIIAYINIHAQSQKEARRFDNERTEKENAKRRFNEYWASNGAEKEKLESERDEHTKLLIKLEKDKNLALAPVLKKTGNIRVKIAMLLNEQKNLGLFKGKEKKALQEKIDYGQNYLAQTLEEINQLQTEFNSKIDGLKNRIGEINNELTKPR